MAHNFTKERVSVITEWSNISEIPNKDCKVFLLDNEHGHITDGFYNHNEKKFVARDSTVEFDYWMESPDDYKEFIGFSKDSAEVITFNNNEDVPVAIFSGFNLLASYNFQKMKTTSDLEKVSGAFGEMIYEDMVRTLNKASK